MTACPWRALCPAGVRVARYIPLDTFWNLQSPAFIPIYRPWRVRRWACWLVDSDISEWTGGWVAAAVRALSQNVLFVKRRHRLVIVSFLQARRLLPTSSVKLRPRMSLLVLARGETLALAPSVRDALKRSKLNHPVRVLDRVVEEACGKSS